MNKQEFYAIVEQHYKDNFKNLVNVFTPKTRGRINAEEVIQEAYTRVLEHWDTYDHELANFDTWFQQIVKNCAKRHMTLEKRHGMFYDVPANGEADAGRAYSRVFLSEIMDVIKKKSLNHRMILTNALVEQAKYKDIAGSMGLSEQYVKNLVNKFRKEINKPVLVRQGV